jgi:transposase
VDIPFELPGFVVEKVNRIENQIQVKARASLPRTVCPTCHHASDRVHSYYDRIPRDLPVSDQSVQLILTVRRFRCLNPECYRKTFAERLPDFVPFKAQRTLRLTATLRRIGFSLSGEAGARLTKHLHMASSPDTLLRIVRLPSPFPSSSLQKLGVDDFALQKGRRYGSILVDLEKRCPIELLSDRTADTLANWLRSRPGIEVITRDRSTEYARGATEGAPAATQIADRWHLLQNLREALERMLNRLHAQLANLPQSDEFASLAKALKRRRSLGEQSNRQAKRERRYQQYLKVKQLFDQGVPILTIADQLGLSRTTIRKFAYADAFPERAQNKQTGSILKPYFAYLQYRFDEGCENSYQLWREIKSKGFSGGPKQVGRWVQQRRETPAQSTPKKYIQEPQPEPHQSTLLAAPRRLVWLLLKEEAKLEKEEKVVLQHISQDKKIVLALALSHQFQEMVRQRKPDDYPGWVSACVTSGILELKNFAEGLQRDEAAVQAALLLPWSNGQVEGQINRLKLIKRQMYGRANLDLLRLKVLYRD